MTTSEELSQLAETPYYASRYSLLRKAAEELEALQKSERDLQSKVFELLRETDELTERLGTIQAETWVNACLDTKRKHAELQKQNAALREALDMRINGLPLHVYLLKQFPATVGHIPLREFFEKQRQALAAQPEVKP